MRFIEESLWSSFSDNFSTFQFLLKVISPEDFPERYSLAIDKIYSDFLIFCDGVELKVSEFYGSYDICKKVVRDLFNISEDLDKCRKDNNFNECEKIISKTGKYLSKFLISDGFDPTEIVVSSSFPFFESYLEYIHYSFGKIIDTQVLDVCHTFSEENYSEEDEQKISNELWKIKEDKDSSIKLSDKLLVFMEKKKRKPHKSIESEKDIAEFYFRERKKYEDFLINYDVLTRLFLKIR